MKAKRKRFVFVGISVLGGHEMFHSVEVSTTLNGLCRLHGVDYERVARAFRRTGIKKEDEGELEVLTDKSTSVDRAKIKILKKELDVIWGRGDVELPKKLKIAAGAGFQGYKNPVTGLKTDKPVERMGFNEVINTWKEGDEE